MQEITSPRPASSILSRASFANGDQRYCTYSPYNPEDDSEDLGDPETPETPLWDYNTQPSYPLDEGHLERDWDVETITEGDDEQEDGEYGGSRSRYDGYTRSLREQNQLLEEEVRRKEEEVRRKDEELKKAEHELRKMREDVKRMAEEEHKKKEEARRKEREIIKKEQDANSIEEKENAEQTRLKQETLRQKEEETTRKDQEIEARERAVKVREEELKRREEEARSLEETRKGQEVRLREAAKKEEAKARTLGEDLPRSEAEASWKKEDEISRKEEQMRRKQEKLREDTEKTRRVQEEANRIAEQARLKQETLRQMEEETRRKGKEIKERERALKAREDELKRREEEARGRLNIGLKPQPGLSKQISKESLSDVPDDGTLWIHSVSQEIVNSVSEQETKRQEAINEVIYTERDFVRDMKYLQDVWINRLKIEDAIPPDRRTDFVNQVFWNVHHIIAINTRLRDALNRRQKSYAVVDCIGDILLEIVPNFGAFVSYGSHQLYGKYEFEKEKASNPAFAQFVDAAERLPESRKLELQAYLTKPTTRLARYPLLLEAVLKHTPSDNSDKTMLPQVISIIRDFLAKVNAESGKTENRFHLLHLDQCLVFKPGEEMNLRLTEEGRKLVYKGTLNKRDGELRVYLFDHALLFAKHVNTKNIEQYKAFRRPIPLELLLITTPEVQKSRNVGNMVTIGRVKNRAVHWINFEHLGRKHYNLMLWATSPISQRKWLEMIYEQQEIVRERSLIFDTVTLTKGFFLEPNKVNCAAPYSGGRRVVYGTDDGVFLSDLREPKQEPVKVLALLDVIQIDVLEDRLLIVLSERRVLTFPLEALDVLDPMAGLERAKRISTHTSFFKTGFCLGRILVCIVKSSQLSSTFKIMELIDHNVPRARAKLTFEKLLKGGNDTLKLFREFYFPDESTSVHYLKTTLWVGCSKGFEIVDPESLDTQGALDPNDESLEFVRKRKNLLPIAVYRIDNEFLLCYDEFAFYINKDGRRCRKEFMIFWEGTPTGFALQEPYVLAFEPSFVEIRHIETGLMTQVIQGVNMRLLFADTLSSVVNNAVHPYSQQNMYNPYAPQIPQHYPQGVGRNGILIASDDRILALRRVIPQPQALYR